MCANFNISRVVFIELFGLEGLIKRSSNSNPTAMGRDTFHESRLLKGPSTLALNSSRDGATTTSLRNRFHCFLNRRLSLSADPECISACPSA